MAKSYVIVKKNYEYNDEGYDVHDGGEPKSVFSDKAEAIEACEVLNAKEFSGIDPCDYVDDYTNTEKLRAKLLKLGYLEENKSTYRTYYSIKSSLSLTDLKHTAQLVPVEFYELYEVDSQ